VHAHDRRALVEKEARHAQFTSRAPWLTVTAGPFMEIVAPCPLLIVMPASDTGSSRRV
jgi:hypothetical protein